MLHVNAAADAANILRSFSLMQTCFMYVKLRDKWHFIAVAVALAVADKMC